MATTSTLKPWNLAPMDHWRTGEPMGHRYPAAPNPPSAPRVYPCCGKCGAWVLGVVCEFCGERLEDR